MKKYRKLVSLMTDIERSVLLSLCDAINAAPEKSTRLLEIVSHHDDKTESYKNIIEILKNSKNVVKINKDIRSCFR